MIAFTIPGAPQGNKSDCRRWREWVSRIWPRKTAPAVFPGVRGKGRELLPRVGDWQGGFPPQTEPGTARGEARARTCRNGHTYTPDNTVLYENLVKTELLRQCGRPRLSVDDRPALSMEIVAVYPVPASYSKRKRVAALAGDGRFAEKKRGFPRQRERPVVDRPAVFPGVRARPELLPTCPS